MTRQNAFKGFVAAVLSSALAGLIVWGVTDYIQLRTEEGGSSASGSGGPGGTEDPLLSVPDVIGEPIRVAMTRLVDEGLMPVEAERRITGKHQPGDVINQRPPADHLAARNAMVELIVEAESVPVPDLMNDRIEQAIQEVLASGLAIGETAVDPPQAQSTGMVVGQAPGPDQRVQPGTTITMVLEGIQHDPPVEDDPSDGGDGDGGGRITRVPEGLILDRRHFEAIERPAGRPSGGSGNASVRPTVRVPDRVLRTRTLENIAIRRPQIARPQDVRLMRLSTPPTPEPIAPADGATLSGSPHRTTLRWRPVDQAKTYTVEVDYKAGDTWLSDAGRTYILKPGLTSTSFTFAFIGAQPGRWRVWAVNEQGIASRKSDWQQFRYTR